MEESSESKNSLKVEVTLRHMACITALRNAFTLWSDGKEKNGTEIENQFRLAFEALGADLWSADSDGLFSALGTLYLSSFDSFNDTHGAFTDTAESSLVDLDEVLERFNISSKQI